MDQVQVMTAKVVLPDGTAVAQIERVQIGGGSQTVTVDGVPEERVHPAFERWHVRLLSPDRMIPDELRDEETYEAAVDLAVRYATKRAEHADAIAELADGLRI